MFALASTAYAPVAVAGRTTYSISYDWKFELEGDRPPQNCSASTFPTDLKDKQCHGLAAQLQVADQETCRETCCADESCSVWQWCVPGSECSPANSCWTGDSFDITSCTTTQKGWASSGRKSAPGPAPHPKPGDKCSDKAWCAAAFDDDKWRGVTLPHDFVVEGTFSESADKAHGYLPFGIGRYRKTLTIPASAQGQHVRLDFEGAQTASTVRPVYLNGVCLGGHGSGYTPFGFELSAPNVSGLVKWGGANVIAVHVDATHPDSWWYDGGGLYRQASLTVAPPLHFEQWGVYAPTTVTGPISADATTAAATLLPAVEVVNDGGGSTKFQLTSVVTLGGKEVARKVDSCADLECEAAA